MGLYKRMQYYLKHRGQPGIQGLEGERIPSDTANARYYFENAYNSIEVASRGVDLIVDGAGEIDINIMSPLNFMPLHEGKKFQAKKLHTLVNFHPNDAEDVSSYRRQLYMDLILTGNCYQYYDGLMLWHLPSKLVEVKSHNKNKVSKYIFNGDTDFAPEEIIHTKDNSSKSVYVGTSRLRPATNSIRTLVKMLAFQEKFFENGAIPGLILTTPNILGKRIKDRMLDDWRRLYNPSTGGKRPLILDGDMKVNPLSQINFRELDFAASVSSHELKILKALGVPPVLLESGNNANIRPNIQLFYELTVLPLASKLISSYERFFAYDMEAEVVKVRALRPEMREAGAYYTGLVNGGIMTINEARAELRLDPSSEEHADELRIPANIAGSAADPNEGGRPPGSEDDSSNGKPSEDK